MLIRFVARALSRWARRKLREKRQCSTCGAVSGPSEVYDYELLACEYHRDKLRKEDE